MTSSHNFDDPPDWDALARFRAGEGTPEERAVVSAWLATHPEELDLVATLDGVVATGLPRASAAPVDVERALSTLHARMDDARPDAPRLQIVRGSSPRRGARWVVGGLAAAAAIAAVLFGTSRVERSGADAIASAGTRSAPREIRTAVGIVDSVTLSDGTQVLLAPSSRLIVADESFGHGSRDVTLEGMARFTVHHDAAAPFTVHVGNAVVRDVGTRFVVRTSHDVPSVAVLEGEVTLGAASSAAPTSLRAGDRGVMNAGGAVMVAPGTASAADEAWVRGRLEYHAAPLDLVRDDLRRWYGIELVYGDSTVAARRLTATFERQGIEAVLKTIALALGADVQRTGSVVTLRAAATPR